jgi:spore coat protein U-like protein
MKKLSFYAIIIGLSSVPAKAVTVTATSNVTLTVVASCTVQSASLAFPLFSGLNPVNQNSNIIVTCTQNTPYFVGLGPGAGSTSVTSRKMTSGVNKVSYGLYKDAAFNNNWGNTGTDRVQGIGNTSPQSIPVYGFIPGPQSSPAGSYTDTVLITVTY